MDNRKAGRAIAMPNDTLLVGFDLTHGPENRLCIVGKKEGGMVTIVNAFQGDEAEELFRRLTTTKTKNRKEEQES